MIVKIEHIALWCADLEAMRDFYVRYFGAKAGEKYTNERKGFSSYFLSFGEGSARLELMHGRNEGLHASGSGIRKEQAHFAFSAGSRHAVDELTARLENDGFSVMSYPRTTGDGYYESAVMDPEGNSVEITV